MANLSETSGWPGLGNGILHPKVRNRFRVLFQQDDGTKLSCGNDISIQLIKISEISQTRFAAPHYFDIIVEDDMGSRACVALQNLFQMESFMTKIEMLDGNETVVRTNILRGCKIDRIDHGGLNYGCGSNPAVVTFDVADIVGNLIEELSDEIKSKFSALNGAKIRYYPETDSWSNNNYKVTKNVSLSYKTLEIV